MKGRENDDTIFFDYRIRGEESDSNVTVYVEFKRGGPNGSVLALNAPATVSLDGQTFPTDSAKLTGAYYEIRRPARSFSGKHEIIFTDPYKKEHKAEFDFQPFYLSQEIPAEVWRDSLVIHFKERDKEEYFRVSATDTSFASRDIVELDTVRNGKLVVPANKLKNLVDGPIVLLLSRELEKHFQSGPEVWGRVVVSYGMEREFTLKTPLSPGHAQ